MAHKGLKLGIALVVFFGMGLVLPPTVHADVYTVNTTEDLPPSETSSCDPNTISLLSLRMAVICANKNPGLDEIRVPAGIYQLTTGCKEYTCSDGDQYPSANAEVGDLDILDHVKIKGDGAEKTVVVMGMDPLRDKIFEVMDNVDLSLSGMTLQGGLSGLIGHTNCSIRIEHSRIDRSASIGIETTDCSNLIVESSLIRRSGQTGIWASRTNLTVRNSLITENGFAGSNYVGGIFTHQIHLVNSTVSQNKCLSGSCSTGGIHLVIFGTYIRNGGHEILPSIIVNSTISNNESSGPGAGGLWVSAYGPGVSTLAITHSTIVDNVVGKGVPIIGEVGCGVSGESGGLYVCRFKDAGVDNFPKVFLTSNIIANNNALKPTTKTPDCSGPKDTIVSNGFNLVRDGTGCLGLKPGDRTGIDPLLGPLQDNGGPTPTHEPSSGSLAIDAVDAAECLFPANDQRGIKRPQGCSKKCDIGAIETVQTCSPPPGPEGRFGPRMPIVSGWHLFHPGFASDGPLSVLPVRTPQPPDPPFEEAGVF